MKTLNKLSTALGLTTLMLGTFISIGTTPNSLNSHAFMPLEINYGSVANAQQYVPPNRGSRPQRTEGSGARGCTNSIPASLNLLIPKDHTARTINARPTFLWQVSAATSAPMVFTLTEARSRQPMFQKRLKADKAGIVRLELPQEAPEMTVGKEYRWTVALVCNEKRPSENINARAWIERVDNTPELSKKLAAASSDRDRALIYAQNGMWYDAMAILNKLQTTNPTEKTQAMDSFISLLEQVGLNQLATVERQRRTN